MQNHVFKLHPSRFYCLFLGLMLLGSGVIILLLPVVFWLKTLFLAVLIVYGIFLFQKFALLRAAFSVVGLQKQDGKQWRVETRTAVFDAVLRGDSTVTTLVSVLRFDVSGQRRPVVCMVFRDSLPAEEYRRLIGVIRMC